MTTMTTVLLDGWAECLTELLDSVVLAEILETSLVSHILKIIENVATLTPKMKMSLLWWPSETHSLSL